MAAYYNEIEPYAAAWLRELMSTRVLPVGSASDPAGGGMSDTTPMSSLAMRGLRLSVVPQAVHAPVGEQSRPLCFRRMTGKRAVRQGSDGRIVCSGCQAAALSWCGRDRLPPSLAGVRGKSEPFWHWRRGGTRRSIATCYAALDLSGTAFRTFCIGARYRVADVGFSSAIGLCIGRSNTCDGCVSREESPRIRRSVVASYPSYLHLLLWR
jgi:hypothetical protein